MAEKVNLPLFDGASVDLDSNAAALSPAAAEALRRFTQMTPADRLATTPHVHAYYRDMHMHADGAWIDENMTAPAHPADIWAHVRPLALTITSRPPRPGTDPIPYVILEANCDWEDEHGLQLVWKEGRDLVRVGEYDGKPLHAENAPSGVVYHSIYDDDFSTYQLK
ncbi:DUF6985 domain-containing protein [Roseobacter sp. MH60115]|uniref:DUF6985 domain-containing protein n=1 Tax=Roseobacter sp. MH60115 TaxID=2785324 RepID=UPI003FA3594C